MNIRIISILYLILLSCNFEKNNQDDGIPVFSKFIDLDYLYNSLGDRIYFSLTKEKSKFIYEDIEFHQFDLTLISNEYQEFSIFFGVKKDSLFVGEFDDSKIDNSLFLFSFENKEFPREVKNTFMLHRDLMIEKVFNDENGDVFKIKCFYNPHHDNPPRFIINEILINKERGIFELSVIDNKNKDVYTSNAQ